MAIKEVRSRISTTSQTPGPGSSLRLSPGARSMPRSDQAASAHPAEPTQARVSLGGEQGASAMVTGPEGRRPVSDSTPMGEANERRSSVSDVTEHTAQAPEK
jgi:hypothetical protein